MESDIIMIISERLQIIYGEKATVREAYEKLCKKFPEITFNTGSSLMSGNEK